MLAFKLAGSFLVLASGIGLAVGTVRYERTRLQVHDALISLLFFIKGRKICSAGMA